MRTNEEARRRDARAGASCWPPGRLGAQQGDTAVWSEVFSGTQGAAFKEDYPPRYVTCARDNGDGAYSPYYGIISHRYMGGHADGNHQHDPGETLEAASVTNAGFSHATSSSTRRPGRHAPPVLSACRAV